MEEKQFDPHVEHLEAATEDLQMKTELSTHSKTFALIESMKLSA